MQRVWPFLCLQRTTAKDQPPMIQSPTSSQTKSPQFPPQEIARPLIGDTLQTVGVFLALWLIFYGVSARFPYLTAGSASIYKAKAQYEFTAHMFPVDPRIRRVLVFGNSKVLAGFHPATFDRLAAGQGIPTFSYNSGYPGRSEFVPQLTKLVEKGNIPDVLL